jgi:hypothetical protein
MLEVDKDLKETKEPYEYLQLAETQHSYVGI